MKLMWFHLMSYTELPSDFRERNPSVWIDIDPKLFDPARGHLMYNDFMYRITQPPLLLWGEYDRVMPLSYADKFASGRPGETTTTRIANARHLADLDQPVHVAAEIVKFINMA